MTSLFCCSSCHNNLTNIARNERPHFTQISIPLSEWNLLVSTSRQSPKSTICNSSNKTNYKYTIILWTECNENRLPKMVCIAAIYRGTRNGKNTLSSCSHGFIFGGVNRCLKKTGNEKYAYHWLIQCASSTATQTKESLNFFVDKIPLHVEDKKHSGEP